MKYTKRAKNFQPETMPTVRNHTRGTRARRPLPGYIEDCRIGDQNCFITSLCMIFSKCKDY